MIDRGHVYCPVCGKKDPEQYFIYDFEVIGCSECIDCVDSFDWRDKHHSQWFGNPYGDED